MGQIRISKSYARRNMNLPDNVIDICARIPSGGATTLISAAIVSAADRGGGCRSTTSGGRAVTPPPQLILLRGFGCGGAII